MYLIPLMCLCLQEDLLVALGQGSRLLESINEPVVRDPDHNMNQDELENLATVQRLEHTLGTQNTGVGLRTHS